MSVQQGLISSVALPLEVEEKEPEPAAERFRHYTGLTECTQASLWPAHSSMRTSLQAGAEDPFKELTPACLPALSLCVSVSVSVPLSPLSYLALSSAQLVISHAPPFLPCQPIKLHVGSLTHGSCLVTR